MSLIWNLFLAQARQQKGRLALTAISMVAAIGAVLWVVTSYEAIAAQFDEQTDEFVGNYSLFIVPQNPDEPIPEDLLSSIQSVPSVEAANAVTQFLMEFRRVEEPDEESTGRGRGIGPMGPSVVGTNSSEPRYPLLAGRWLDTASSNEAVISSVMAEALSIEPQDSIEFESEAESGEAVTLQVVGITEQVEGVEFAMTRTKGGAPGGVNRGPASLAAYVPMKVIESLTGETPRITLVEIRLAPEAGLEELESVIASATPAVEFLRPEDVREKIAGGFQAEGARKQAYFVTALSLLASAFIIFTTLSMGVNERARQLAVFRAVGLRRSQVATLIFTEAMVLAVFGWIGGVAGGWVLLQFLANANPEMAPNGVQLGSTSILLTAACSLVGAGLASILPVWRATRVSPLEAMSAGPPRPTSSSSYASAAVLSILLISVNPVLVYALDVNETLRFGMIMLVGVPTTIIGFVLLAPVIVLGVERVLSPFLAWLLQLQSTLVASQLSTNMWRTAGVAASLMLGLGLYTATHVWGRSMLGGFLPGKWTPTTIVKFDPGLPKEAITEITETPGVVAERCLPIAVEQTKLLDDPLRSQERDTAVRQDNVTLVGLNATAAFGGDNPMFRFEFVQGDREEAIEKMGTGRYCIVPDIFNTFAGLNVGDSLGFVPPNAPDRPVKYEIAGIVKMPGSNWITKLSGMRRNFVRTAGLVFAPEQLVREDFVLPLNEYFWLDMQPGVTATELESQLRPVAGLPPLTDDEGPRGRSRRAFGNAPLKVTSLDDVRATLRERGGGAVDAMGWLPLITLIVVSLGIVNAIAASVRARQWEFGILRAVGVRRFGLTKLVLSEAILIGFVASVLSLIFGILTGWTCLGIVGYITNKWFEGVATPLIIPWSSLVFGYALTFTLCVIAALWPAISTGRSEPLALLKAGRSVN